MNRYLVFILCFTMLLGICRSAAQNDSASHHTLYAELLGNGDVYSLNYEYLFRRNGSIRIGASWIPGTYQISGKNDRFWLDFPVEYNYLLGKGASKLEVSGGFLIKWSIYKEFPNQLVGTPQISSAYRFQRKKGGLFVRTGITLFIPFFLSIDRYEAFSYTQDHWLFWPSVALGWSF